MRKLNNISEYTRKNKFTILKFLVEDGTRLSIVDTVPK